MVADDHQLKLIASADDQPRLDQVIKVVTSHLERFAFRENPDLHWSNPAAPPTEPITNRST
ncbi:MAG: DUF2218 domain-containing protein [Pseudomonadota bacterium]